MSGLGALGVLPPEIRRQIWQLCVPQDIHIADPRRQGLGVLQTSHAIYQECSYEIYHYENLVIKLKPGGPFTGRWEIELTTGQIYDLGYEEAREQGWGEFPWHRLPSIRIEITAPDTLDSGQALCAYKLADDLVDFLNTYATTGLPQVDIVPVHQTVFRNNVPRIVTFDSFPHIQTTFDAAHAAQYPVDQMPLGIPDYKLALIPFQKLRGTSSAHVFESLQQGPQLQAFTRQIEQLMALPRGTNIAGEVRRHTFRKHLFRCVEATIDSNQSYTGARLRAYRFATWFSDRLEGNSRYEIQLLTNVDNRSKRTINHRYRMMRMHNPVTTQARLNGQAKDFWDLADWKFVYHGGIIPIHLGVSPQLAQDFELWRAQEEPVNRARGEREGWLNTYGRTSYFAHLKSKYPTIRVPA